MREPQSPRSGWSRHAGQLGRLRRRLYLQWLRRTSMKKCRTPASSRKSSSRGAAIGGVSKGEFPFCKTAVLSELELETSQFLDAAFDMIARLEPDLFVFGHSRDHPMWRPGENDIAWLQRPMF